VRGHLGFTGSEVDEDLLRNIRYLDLSQYNISSLEGLQHCRGLKALYLKSGTKADLRPVRDIQGLDIQYK
jgi:Leucine-rich repeat (LRR) protein